MAEYFAWLRLTYFPKKVITKAPKIRDEHINHYLCLTQKNLRQDKEYKPMNIDKESFAADLISYDTFMKDSFHIQVESVSEGDITLRLPFSDILLGNVFIPCLHGGVTAAAVEYAGLACAKSVLTTLAPISTVNYSINYLKPAPCADMLIDSVIANRGGRVHY